MNRPGHDLTPLGELIQARQDATGWSMRRLEREVGISKTMLGKYKRGPLTNMPDTASLRRLAAVLAMPESIVVEAALTTVGLASPRGNSSVDIEDVIRQQAYLDEADREGLLALIRAKRRGRSTG